MIQRDRLLRSAVRRAAEHLRKSIRHAMSEDHSQRMIHQLARARHELWQIERFLGGIRPNDLEDPPTPPRPRPIDVPCYTCGATPGLPCAAPSDVGTHGTRKRLAASAVLAGHDTPSPDSVAP